MAESELKDSLLKQDYTIPVDENGSAIVQELYTMEKVKNKDKKELSENTSSEEDQLIHTEE
jgi:hypothetical protein